MPNILDKSFKYRSSAATDVRLTFARERARLKALELAKQRAAETAAIKVTAIKARAK